MRTSGLAVVMLVVSLGVPLAAVAGGAEGRAGEGAAAGAPEQSQAEDRAELAASLRERADEAFDTGRYKRAEELYVDVINLDPSDGLAWYRLGYSRHAQGKYEQAVSAHKRASSFESLRAPALYNLACALARLGRIDEAIATLEDAAIAGFADAETMEQDPDLETLRGDGRYTKALAQVRENGASLPLRVFDFWVGTWDVYNPEGTIVGHSVVKRLHNGHVIEENWISARGTTGMSMNFYDPERGVWRQVWVSMGGDVVEYEGGFRDGAMRMEGKHVKLDGTRTLQRVSFTPTDEGTVRQLIEESSDGGKTWTTYFDGTYVQRVLPLDVEIE